jgi:site-specific recombinase XerD
VNASRRQLFSILARVEVPTTVLRLRNNTRLHNQRIDRFPFVRWPAGSPCEPVNAYLIESASGVTGDTLKTYASELSPLIRYCAEHHVGFEQLDDAHFFALSKQLQTERSRNHATERARNNNTVRALLSRSIAFLMWYQVRLMLPTQSPLIGQKEASPRIAVRRAHNPHGTRQGTYYYVHRAMPTSNSREPKQPIAQSMIEDIELMIEKLSDFAAQKEPATRRHRKNTDQLRAQLEYIRARRRFMVWIMKRTGLRPAEMTELPLKVNTTVLQTKRLIIPTKKRRKTLAPLRSVPITLKDAAIFQRYLIAREIYIRQVQQADPAYQSPVALFLSADGKAIKKTSLEKDFERLVKACGYTHVQACFSMFRHRFVTYEVIVHLKEFMGSAGKTRQLMTDSDYRSILKRIAAKTGHGSPESLWHYIDLAWEEMDVWANVNRNLERVHAADRLYEDLLDLRHSLHADSALSAIQILDIVAGRLSAILTDAK